jgi:hypothetical protein
MKLLNQKMYPIIIIFMIFFLFRNYNAVISVEYLRLKYNLSRKLRFCMNKILIAKTFEILLEPGNIRICFSLLEEDFTKKNYQVILPSENKNLSDFRHQNHENTYKLKYICGKTEHINLPFKSKLKLSPDEINRCYKIKKTTSEVELIGEEPDDE